MATISPEQIIKQFEERKQKAEQKANVNFIPFEGEEYDVVVTKDDPTVLNETAKSGVSYEYHVYKVVHDGKTKNFRVFPNQSYDLQMCLKNHPNRAIHVSRPRGSKQLLFS